MLWTLGNHITTSNQSSFIATPLTRSQDFVQEEASLTWAQGTHYQKKLKTPRTQKIYFRFFHFLFILALPSGGREGAYSIPLGHVPAAGRINSGEIHNSMIPALNTSYSQCIQKKNANVVLSPYITARRPPEGSDSIRCLQPHRSLSVLFARVRQSLLVTRPYS